MKTLRFSEWKEKTKKGTSEGIQKHYFKERVKFRDVSINSDYKIEEGEILSYLEREQGEKDYKKEQQHLVGYRYISVISMDKDKDVFWMQQNHKGGKWGVLADDALTCYGWFDFKKALIKFNNLLKKRFNARLEVTK